LILNISRLLFFVLKSFIKQTYKTLIEHPLSSIIINKCFFLVKSSFLSYIHLRNNTGFNVLFISDFFYWEVYEILHFRLINRTLLRQSNLRIFIHRSQINPSCHFYLFNHFFILTGFIDTFYITASPLCINITNVADYILAFFTFVRVFWDILAN